MRIFNFTTNFILILCLTKDTFAGTTMVDLKCTPNILYCKDPICILNKTVDVAKPKLVHITLGCTLTKDVPQLSGKIKLFNKQNNKYVRVGYNMNVEMDFCKVSTILKNQVLTTFVPHLTDQMAATFHSCPYTGNFLVEKFAFDGQRVHAIPGWKNTKAELTFFRGSYVPLLTVEFYTRAD